MIIPVGAHFMFRVVHWSGRGGARYRTGGRLGRHLDSDRRRRLPFFVAPAPPTDNRHVSTGKIGPRRRNADLFDHESPSLDRDWTGRSAPGRCPTTPFSAFLSLSLSFP